MKECFVTICYSILLFGCVGDAPRDNPLDPLSAKYREEGSVTGRTIIVKQTIGSEERAGVAGVSVYNVEKKIFVITDSAGYFSFNNLSEGMHTFICTKRNFTSDTFEVQIQPGKSTSVERFLNGAPVVLSQSILARKIDFISFNPKYFVDVEAVVTDPNGINDLKLVWFKVKDSLYAMDYFPNLGKFLVTLDKSRFPTNTIQWLTGDTLQIVSEDGSGAMNISDPFFITRIIENSSTPLSPTSSDTIPKNSLVMKWKPPDVAFNYTSTVAIIRADPENETVVMTIPGLTSFYEQYPYDDAVLLQDEGKYYWYVTIVDEFGNYSRSKEAYFIAK